MGVTIDFINNLKAQVANLKDLQDVNRLHIAEADAVLAEAQRVRDDKVMREEDQIAKYQKEIDNLVFTIQLLEAQLPADGGEIVPPVSEPPATPTE